MPQTPNMARLRCAKLSDDDNKVEVDEKEGVIKNVAVMSLGDAKGWGFTIDKISLAQFMQHYATFGENGVPVRFQHPEDLGADDLGSEVGYLRNARLEDNQIRGDVYLGSWSSSMPGLGDVKTYLMEKAKTDPTACGMSAVFPFETEEITDPAGNVTGMAARLLGLEAVDFVGSPAANPNGLLSAKRITVAPPSAPRNVTITISY